MPSTSYNGQSFAIDGRRFWVLGASIHYARVPMELWPARIAAAKQAGFNTIETACPWMVHEPRKGRFVFDGNANVKQFIKLCAAANMRVLLRIGPFIGSGYDGGGLPGWLIEIDGIRLREDDQLFLEHVSHYFRRLISEFVDLQVNDGGPVLLVQAEHAWTCSNQEQADSYLAEINRFIRESGVTAPITNSNDLWQDLPGTIDTWRGYDDLLVHLRQLRTVQPDAPRLVAFQAADFEFWGEKSTGEKQAKNKSGKQGASGHAAGKSPGTTLRRLAEVLASGAQPIVSPFHAGSNFDFLGGRIPGGPDRFITTSLSVDPPLGEAGTRGRKFQNLRRLMTFANHFSHVFAELDPDYHPIVLDPEAVERANGDGKTGDAIASVVPLRGPQGRIVFVFGEPDAKQSSGLTLVLDGGIRLPVHLGDQPVAWFALDVDLQGVGRLDYSNICPWAFIDRAVMVFHGPEGAHFFISIGGTPLEGTVPSTAAGPLVAEHKGLTIAVCNQEQIDFTYHDETSVYVGVSGFDLTGAPQRAEQIAKAYVIRKDAQLETLAADRAPNRGGSGARKSPKRDAAEIIAPNHWHAAPATAYSTGESPRFASLEGPETLSACGASTGYGWYRVNLNSTGKKLCHLPQAADRLHLFMEGKRQRVFGVGPGADASPFDLRIASKGQPLVILADNLGRFSDGNDVGQRKGVWGDIFAVKPLRSVKPKIQNAKPVNPFKLRGFIAQRDADQLSDAEQTVWTFAHTRKSPIVIDVQGAACSGTFVLNDTPIAYYAGATGACLDRFLIDPETSESFKRGKNVLRFAPDLRQGNANQIIAKAATLYECVESLTEEGSWAFAKWEPPAAAMYSPLEKGRSRDVKGTPCWWRSTVELQGGFAADDLPLWLELSGMSKGQAYINGKDLGRYFVARADGKPVGPRTRMYVPGPWVKADQMNEIVLFDEHGCEPIEVRLIRGSE